MREYVRTRHAAGHQDVLVARVSIQDIVVVRGQLEHKSSHSHQSACSFIRLKDFHSSWVPGDAGTCVGRTIDIPSPHGMTENTKDNQGQKFPLFLQTKCQ